MKRYFDNRKKIKHINLKGLYNGKRRKERQRQTIGQTGRG